MRRNLPLFAFAAGGLGLLGCGGGLPLAHPAHVLPSGKVTAGAGVDATIVADPRVPLSAPNARLQSIAVGPAVAPWIGARVGLGGGFEGGIGASSRAVRIDGRRAFTFRERTLAFSAGAGVSAILASAPSGEASGVLGGGVDVPLLFGWRSSADLYAAWIGPRLRAQIFDGRVSDAAGSIPLEGRSVGVGGVAGLRAGLRHVFAVVEADVAYQWAWGTFGAEAVRLSGWTVTPFGGLVLSF